MSTVRAMNVKIIFPAIEHLTSALRSVWTKMPEIVARNLAADLYIVLITIIYLIFGDDLKIVAFSVSVFWVALCFIISSIVAREPKKPTSQ